LPLARFGNWNHIPATETLQETTMPNEMLTAEQVKERLGRGGVTALAREIGVSKPHLSLVLNGHRRSPRVEAAIAARVGVPTDQIFAPLAQSAA
jgi:transcriptional regulator with XRE-family HTH domain